MSDIDFHGFIVKKKRLRDKAFVTKSQLDNFVIGTVISYLNGTPLCDLKPTEVNNMFRSRAIKLVRSTSPILSSTVRIF
jgi:hypothetical protein